MKQLARRSDPHIWAISYAVVVSLLVAAASSLEGTLYSERTVQTASKLVVQHPYINNFSTVLDFAVFNPIAIYFLLKTRNGFSEAYAHFKSRSRTSVFDRAGLAAVSMTVGLSAMWFYFRGFVSGTFFTETFAPSNIGGANITITGWLIFVATALFISLVVFVGVEFGSYVLFIRALDTRRFRFRLPPNVSEDVEVAIAPCLSAAYALATLFAILAVFVLRDFLQFEIRQSWRVWLFAPYIAVCGFTFLPFWYLHNVMAAQRREMIDSNNSVIENEISTYKADSSVHEQQIDPKKLVVSIDKIEKLQSFYRTIPIWPASSNALIIPNVSVLISGASLAYKLFDSIRAVIK